MSTSLHQMTVDGTPIWVEVSEQALHVGAPPLPGDTVRTSTSLQQATQGLVKADIDATLAAIVAPLHRALEASRPDEASVELSLGLKGEVGVFVAKGEGNASIKITVKWKFPAAPASPSAH